MSLTPIVLEALDLFNAQELLLHFGAPSGAYSAPVPVCVTLASYILVVWHAFCLCKAFYHEVPSRHRLVFLVQRCI